jgi:hypothetical protein
MFYFPVSCEDLNSMDILSSELPKFLTRGETYRVVIGDSVILPCQAENLSKNSIETNKISIPSSLRRISIPNPIYSELERFYLTLTLTLVFFISVSLISPPSSSPTFSFDSTSFGYLWVGCPKLNFSVRVESARSQFSISQLSFLSLHPLPLLPLLKNSFF